MNISTSHHDADNNPRPGAGGSGTGQDTKTRIIVAARQLFSERSFTRVSLKDIAAEAGVSTTLIVKHFTNKERLFRLTLDFSDSARALFSGPFGQLGMTACLETVTAPTTAPYSIIRILAIADGGNDTLQAIGARIKEDLLQVLARRIAQEAPHANPSPELRAQSAVALLVGLSFMRRVGDIDYPAYARAEIIDHYAELVQDIINGTD